MHYEIVKVIDRANLLDPRSRRRRYETRDRRHLTRGIYAVVWPESTSVPRYDQDARFYGPYPSWTTAGNFIRDSFPDIDP